MVCYHGNSGKHKMLESRQYLPQALVMNVQTICANHAYLSVKLGHHVLLEKTKNFSYQHVAETRQDVHKKSWEGRPRQ